jgi:gliding motility-associated-like protein
VGDAVFFYPIPYNAGPPMNSSYHWWLNGNTFSTEPAIGILFNGAGNFQLTVQETNYGCPGPVVPNSVSLQVLAPPTGVILGPLQVCIGDTIYYHVNLNPNTYYEWTTSGGIPDTSNNELNIVFDTPGIYTIDLLVLNQCGQALGHKNVIVSEHPDPTFSILPDSVCVGDSVTVNYSGTSTSPLTFAWNFGGGTGVPGGNSPGPHHVVWSTPGVHQIIMNITKYSCPSKDTNYITVMGTPTPLFSFNNVCFGSPTVFIDSSLGSPTSWIWNFGDGGPTSTQVSPNHIYADTGSYSVQLFVTNGTCSDTLSQTVVVYQIPTSIFTTIDPICFGETSTITYTGNAPPNANFVWNFPGASILSGTGQGPYVISWPDSGMFYVGLSVTQNICPSDSTSDSILVKNCEIPPIPLIELVIPNIVTTNGDGKNDIFHITGLEGYPQSLLEIYNRWGKLIYQNSNYLNDWNGGGCSDGVYYYILTLKDGSSRHGSVTLIQ